MAQNIPQDQLIDSWILVNWWKVNCTLKSQTLTFDQNQVSRIIFNQEILKYEVCFIKEFKSQNSKILRIFLSV